MIAFIPVLTQMLREMEIECDFILSSCCEGPRRPPHVLGCGLIGVGGDVGEKGAGDGAVVLFEKYIIIYFTGGICHSWMILCLAAL